MKNMIDFPDTYFEDEVRDGFYVNGMMKKAWAAQMEVLAVVDAICKKYDIQYFADAGTLLGAVRHGGFIPWDDDLDICMKRADYMRFCNVAQPELPDEFFLFNIHTSVECDIMLSRVVNMRAICFGEDHLQRFHDFPYVSGIDIFPLDDIIPDPEAEEARCEIAKYINTVVEGMDSFSKDILEEHLCQIEELCKVKIDRDGEVKNQIYLLLENTLMIYDGYDAEEIALIPEWAMNGGNKFKKEWYRESIWLPFEHIKIPVPVMYDAVLRSKYGDYMRIVKSWGYHDFPYYKKFEIMVQEKMGVSIEPKYSFSMDDLQRGKDSSFKSVKEQAAEIAGLMEQAHGVIRSAIESCDAAAAMELLEMCQSSAISLGNRIEQSEGEGTVTVGILEEYCEFVYQIYEKIVQGIPQSPDQAYQELDGLLWRIRDSVEHDIRVRKEVVFLPYKASHWDSLESVWRAAKEDPDCDVYVVPIPYYYKNLDGSFRKMCYEGNEFPEDVPVIWYENYEFAKRRPDVIFIQNPYDEYNHVTSVHPFFYSKKLKQYTDQLVYIPYFVLDEIYDKNERGFLSLEYFVTMPGVVHADKVIVQSEHMRQTYIDYLCDFAGEDTRSIWEEKILGLGSPKDDKAVNVGKEELDVPAEWQSVLRKSDGSWKKVILYRISLSHLLQHQEKMLRKLESVFRTFEEQQNEVALLWNPDPLIKATVPFANPKLWKKYQKIVEQYQADGWGIYDDSIDQDLALGLCDAYYGDTSPLVQPCKRRGKPVMMQDVEL